MPVETAFCLLAHRYFPTTTIGPFAKLLQDSGVVDYVMVGDYLGSYWPRQVWDPATVPLANVIPDLDSFSDPLVCLGFAAASAPNLGLVYGGTPALRVGPAEVMRAALTLATATSNRTIVTLGAGEALNSIPFGYQLSDTLKRVEDHLRLYKLLQECDGPFDFDGHVWKYRSAYIGTCRDGAPQMWVLGAGPKLLGLAAKYADGWSTCIPCGVNGVEAYAAKVKLIKEMVEREGRDPEKFGFMGYMACVIHEDPDYVAQACEHPMSKFGAATFGRYDQKLWYLDGVDPIFPDDWNYSPKMLPWTMTDEVVNSIVSRVSQEMASRAWICGSPKEVAEVTKDYIDAGMTICAPYDMLATLSSPEDFDATIKRQLEFCQLIKDF